MEIRSYTFGIITVLTLVLLISIAGIGFADSGVNATPEVQNIVTGTAVNAQGTVTETDSGAWTTTYDPGTQFFNFIGNIIQQGAPQNNILFVPVPSGNYIPATAIQIAAIQGQLQPLGGSVTFVPLVNTAPLGYGKNHEDAIIGLYIPGQLLNSPFPGPTGSTSSYEGPSPATYQAAGLVLNPNGPNNIVGSGSTGLHDGTLDPGQVQYTTGYNDQYSGISGQQTFAKSVAVSTANKIADQSNIKANTNIQYIAIDTGRATRSEDLLVDGAGDSTATASAILCPFAASVSAVIPPYCNIAQAGSAFDTTLTSTVTSADTRFVGTDSTFPVVLNYNINAEGLTIGNQSSPMIGSVSAYLKVHVQEARNSTATKSEDLVYSETSSASGLVSKFSKSMSYQSGMNLI